MSFEEISKPAERFSRWESLTRCCLCESEQIDRKFFPDIWICRACFLLFRNPRPSQIDIISSYDTGVTYAVWQKEIDLRTMLWRKRLNILLRYKRSGTLLDVGTGDGFFLDFARTFFTVDATEVSETGAAYARSRGYSPAIGDICRLNILERHYAVITLWHVLEHLPFPGAALHALARSLKRDGILVIAVPNESGSLIKHRLTGAKGSPFGFLEWGREIHLTHFTPPVLSNFLSSNGFRILEAGVDDVHLERIVKTLWAHYGNRLLNALLKLQFDRAMYFVCRLDGN